MINEGNLQSTAGSISKKRKETATKRKAQFRLRMRNTLQNQNNLQDNDIIMNNPNNIMNNIINKKR